MNIHEHARKVAASRGITVDRAMSILGKRGANARRHHYGTLQLSPGTKADIGKAFATREPTRTYWWQKD